MLVCQYLCIYALMSLHVLLQSSLSAPNANFQEALTRSLRRAKWLDDDVAELGLVLHPQIGLDRAEVILALCSMLHGPLSKLNPYAFARYDKPYEYLNTFAHTNILNSKPFLLNFIHSLIYTNYSCFMYACIVSNQLRRY